MYRTVFCWLVFPEKGGQVPGGVALSFSPGSFPTHFPTATHQLGNARATPCGLGSRCHPDHCPVPAIARTTGQSTPNPLFVHCSILSWCLFSLVHGSDNQNSGVALDEWRDRELWAKGLTRQMILRRGRHDH
jgi:hypothetical protein